MSERLRPRDLAFLDRGDAEHAAPQRDGRDLRPRADSGGFDYDAAGRADPRPDLVRAALPPAGAGGPGPPRQPGLGRRRALRPRLPRTPLRAAAPGHHRPAARAGRRGSCRARSTGAGRCGRSTSSRASPTAGSRCSPSPTRRWSTASTPSTSARCCSTSDPEAKSSAATSGARTGDPSPPGCWPAPSTTPSPSATPSSTPSGSAIGVRAAHGGPARRGRGPGASPALDRPPVPTAASPISRRALPAAPVRGASRPTSPTTARCARRTAAPSTT